jgi:plastocyanin
MKTTHSPDPRSWFYLLLLASLLLVTACEGITYNPNPGVTPTTAVSSPTSVIGNSSPTLTGSTPTATPKPTQTPSPTPTPASNTTVTITTNSSGAFIFSPGTLTVAAGTTVVWKNQTQVTHSVIGNTFGGGTISPGGTLSFKFTSAGTFAYHCSIHPGMTGTIIVK